MKPLSCSNTSPAALSLALFGSLSLIATVTFSGCSKTTNPANKFVNSAQVKTDAQENIKAQAVQSLWCCIQPTNSMNRLTLVPDSSYRFESLSAKDATTGDRDSLSVTTGTWTLNGNFLTATNSKSADLNFTGALSADGSQLNLTSGSYVHCTGND